MPGYKGHIVGGVILNTGYIAALTMLPLAAFIPYASLQSQPLTLAGLFILSMLFALFPDIDTNSKGQDIFIGMALLIDIVLIFNGYYVIAAYLGLLAMTPIVGKHRGWTHSKSAMFLVPAPILLFSYMAEGSISDTVWLIYGAAVIGYFSHLLLDGLITKHIRFKGSR